MTFHIRFLSTSTGFRYLYALGYVQKEMDDWFEVRKWLHAFMQQSHHVLSYTSIEISNMSLNWSCRWREP